MKPFLVELAERLLREHTHPGEVKLVFPNRRAALYFRKYLGMLLKKPAFAPSLLTIEDFIGRFSELQVPDKLELVHRLYVSYREVVKIDEPFDQFYFWGEMLLRDFDEVDKYGVKSALLFKDLSNQKELDERFDFLSPEQTEFLKGFWGGFESDNGTFKKKFLQVWTKLPEVYDAFRKQLLDAGLAYEGMLHREVAAHVIDQKVNSGPIWFAGFNALTKAEEIIITHFVENHQAQVHWDVDDYYLNNKTQEAGEFFRQYQQHPVLGKTFPQEIPAHIKEKKSVHVVGAAQPVGQAKIMSQILREQLAKGILPEETLIVLPDEKLMLPVLHGISASVGKMNVTMGFSLGSTPMFNLIELLVELQVNRKGDLFNHRQVLALLGHPYIVAADTKSAQEKRRKIVAENLVGISGNLLRTDHLVYQQIFQEVNAQGILSYLKQVVQVVGTLEHIDDFDREYAFYFLRLLNRMEDLLGQEYSNLRSFLRLFRQLVRTQKIPFTGEPLKGLQIMGVLETRNLDFKNVFILSLNEGAFPATGSKGSYIPYNIRKAYGLPTVEHQDAMYAYLFYRVLQRAENIYLFYSSETDVLGQGEMSRYLQQLIYESGMDPSRTILHNSIQPQVAAPIVIQKDDAILEMLGKLNEGSTHFKGISPSALNAYIECRLKFYFKHVAKIREPDEVEEDIDARVMGNFLHGVMELFYLRIREKKGSKLVESADFDQVEKKMDALIDDVFIREYSLDPKKKVEYEGQRIVVREVVKKFALRIVEIDKRRVPFTVEAVEQGGLLFNVKISQAPGYAVIGGKIDRIDRKDNVVRVIDYKTGKDAVEFESVSSLFEQSKKRNKAAFQTLLYALLYKTNFSAQLEGTQLLPGLIGRVNVFSDEFQFGLVMDKKRITDATPILQEFEGHLRKLLEEIFNPDEKFDQTPIVESCRICPYQGICYR